MASLGHSDWVTHWGLSWTKWLRFIQYIPRNMHTVFALVCFVVVIHWLIFPYPSGLLHWHCGNLTIAPVPAKQPWWIWINISCEFIMNDCITTTKQSTTKPYAYFLGYTVEAFSKCILTHGGLVMPYGDINMVNIGSGNGLLPDGTKPLPEPMLAYHCQSSVAIILGHYHKKIWKY